MRRSLLVLVGLALAVGCPETATPDAGGSPFDDDPLPTVDGGLDPDAGDIDPDPDAGNPNPDPDAGPKDAGLPPADAGTPTDAGYDAGAPPADAGFDAGAVLCPGDDAIGGAVGAPAQLSGVTPTDALRTCLGAASADVFEIAMNAGERLEVTAATTGFVDGATVTATDPDLDLFIMRTAPVIDAVSDNIVGLVVDSSASTDAWERVAAAADVAETWYVVVTSFSGPPADYTLTWSAVESCGEDADCDVGDETCQVGIDVDHLRVFQTCEAWTPVVCTAPGVEEGGADNHSDTGAYAVTAPVNAISCPGDVDVFEVTAAAGDTLAADVSAPAIALSQFLVVTLVDPAGEIAAVDLAFQDEPDVALRELFVEEAGTWRLYVEHYPPDVVAADLAYTVDLRALPACRTDADCGGDVCGGQLDEHFGILNACAPDPGDVCGENDTDNSRTTAQALAPVPGTQLDVTGNNTCVRGPDWFRIPVADGVNALRVDLTWADPNADLDLYLYGPDGSFLGLAFAGDGTETVLAQALAAGDYYVAVDTFACGFDADNAPIACQTLFPYQLAVNIGAGQACLQDAPDCEIGGTGTGDLAADWSCDTTTGLCERPTPTALLTAAAGEGCFDSLDCASVLCLEDTCTLRCADDATCDAVYGADLGQCIVDFYNNPFCREACTVVADCTAVLGDDVPVDCVDGTCEFTP